MKLSILDQAVISSGKSARDALLDSTELAKIGDRLGYSRYWIAEHHDFPGLACPSPEIMLAYIGQQTKSIRIGSGAILLPHYKPFKIAENFNLLATLFPNRIDLGVGRAPGGSAEVSIALSGNFLENVRNMPDSFQTLLHLLQNEIPKDHPFLGISAAPLPMTAPQPWLLGTSGKSAQLAAEKGVSYAFGQFMSEKNGTEIVSSYKKQFKPSNFLSEPYSIVTVSVICAESTDKAQELSLSNLAWSIKMMRGEKQEALPSIVEAKKYLQSLGKKEIDEASKHNMIIGNPLEVKSQLEELINQYNADEVMIITNVHRSEDKIKSYELVAHQFLP